MWTKLTRWPFFCTVSLLLSFHHIFSSYALVILQYIHLVSVCARKRYRFRWFDLARSHYYCCCWACRFVMCAVHVCIFLFWTGWCLKVSWLIRRISCSRSFYGCCCCFILLELQHPRTRVHWVLSFWYYNKRCNGNNIVVWSTLFLLRFNCILFLFVCCWAISRDCLE